MIGLKGRLKRSFVDQLTELSIVSQGDLQLALVYLTVEAAGKTNVSRITDVTGIPRETVRRKLFRLEAMGMIRKVQRAEWEVV